MESGILIAPQSGRWWRDFYGVFCQVAMFFAGLRNDGDGAGGVLEPQSWALLIVGFGNVRLAARGPALWGCGQSMWRTGLHFPRLTCKAIQREGA